MTSDLSILSVEMYDDRHLFREREYMAERATEVNHFGGFVFEDSARTDSNSNPKHNSKVVSRKRAHPDDDDDDDELSSKKQRGRPRLGNKDETAAERRRTQIRLAQRAYRQRKESTISSLNKKVENLENVIAEMNMAFMRFNDVAMASDIFQLRPQLARTLKETTQKFISLVPTSGLDLELSDDSRKSSRGCSRRPKTLQATSNTRRRNKKSSTSTGSEPRSESLSSLDASESNQVPDRRLQPETAQLIPFDKPKFTSPDFSLTNPNETASVFLPELLPHQQQPNLYHNQIPTPSLKTTSLPGPFTFSFQETTFARRLHRATVEAGYHLLSNPSSPPEGINRVFKIALRSFSKDQILSCLRSVLLKSNRDAFGQTSDICNANGANPENNLQRRSPMNAWTIDTPNSVVPMPRKQLENLPKGSIVEVPGLEGEWLDAEAVESYLQYRGVFLDGMSSFAEVGVGEILGPIPSKPTPFYHLSVEDSLASLSSGASSSATSSPSLSSSSRSPGIESQNATTSFRSSGKASSPSTCNTTPPLSYPPLSEATTSDSTTAPSFPTAAPSSPMTMAGLDSFNPFLAGPTPFPALPASSPSPLSSLSLSPLSSLSDFSGEWQLSDFDLGLEPTFGSGTMLEGGDVVVGSSGDDTSKASGGLATEASRTKLDGVKTLLDVDRLLKEIIATSVCLGQSPGYRRRDVDRALAVAVVGF